MTTLKPKVTIMIPTYNQEDYIREAIESALLQDYENLDVVISDDCSTDKTGEIAKHYAEIDCRCKYYRNEKNLGRVGNYHHTLYDIATGDWVVNLDGDDYYTNPKFISTAISRIMENDNVICYFSCRYLSKNLTKGNKKEFYLLDGKFYLINYFKIGSFAHMGTLFRRDVAIKDKQCYTFQGLQSDFHGIIRYCCYGNVIIAQEKGLRWRIHGENSSFSIDLQEKYLSEITCQKEIAKEVSSFYSEKELSEWLKEGDKWAKRDYVKNSLTSIHTPQTIWMGIKNYEFTYGYTIIFIKSIIACFFRINLFK